MSSTVVFNNVNKTFSQKQAVIDLNLDIKEGELFGLIGPNGAGKTTTIKMATGLMRQTSGDIQICGYDIKRDDKSAKSHLGYVPDMASLYDKLTGMEMLQLSAGLYGVSKDVQKSRINGLLDNLELGDVSNQLISSYSRGMKQKLALGCALVHNPKVLFLDEPTVGIDPVGNLKLKNILKELVLKNHTVFLSTHALDIATELCDRIGVFYDGRLIALGTIEELRIQATMAGGGELSLEQIFFNLTNASTKINSLMDVLE